MRCLLQRRTAMDHTPHTELDHHDVGAAIPATWSEPITIGSEAPADTTDGFVDDRFEATDLGTGYDDVEEVTVPAPAAVARLGGLSTHAAIAPEASAASGDGD